MMTKVIFRPHRSSLDEAMKEVRVFDSVETMINRIVDDHNLAGFGPPIKCEDVTVDQNEIDDVRIGWKDTRYVLIKDHGVAGMCATKW